MHPDWLIDQQNVLYPHAEILFDTVKRNTDACYIKDEKWTYTRWNKPVNH